MFKPNNLDFNNGLSGAYTEIPNQGEMLKIFKFRANYELDIFNLNSHEESIRVLLDKLEKDIEALRAHLCEVQLPKSATNIDELIAKLHELQRAGHTDVYAYTNYYNDGHALTTIKLHEIATTDYHRKDNPELELPDSIIIWDNE